MSNAWSTVFAYEEQETTLAVLTPDFVTVMQDYYGTNFNYDGAIGVFQVFVNGVEKTKTSEVTYTVFSLDNCEVTINNITGVDKGKFTVTELTGDLGAAVLRATIDGNDYDRTLSVIALNEGYIIDISEPSEQPDNLEFITGFNHFQIYLNSPPTYTEGHGHGQTNVYYARVLHDDPAPDFADADLLGAFKETVSEDFIIDFYEFSNELTQHDYDHYVWLTYVTKDGTEGAASSPQLFNFNTINTRSISENAVTMPISAESFSSMSPLTLVSTDFGDRSVLITVNASGLLLDSAGESANMEIRLDTTLIHTIPMLVGTQEVGDIPMASGSFNYIDTPGAGEHVYELTVTGLDSVLYQSITAIGLKR
jgi:hypothetical protein